MTSNGDLDFPEAEIGIERNFGQRNSRFLTRKLIGLTWGNPKSLQHPASSGLVCISTGYRYEMIVSWGYLVLTLCAKLKMSMCLHQMVRGLNGKIIKIIDSLQIFLSM